MEMHGNVFYVVSQRIVSFSFKNTDEFVRKIRKLNFQNLWKPSKTQSIQQIAVQKAYLFSWLLFLLSGTHDLSHA